MLLNTYRTRRVPADYHSMTQAMTPACSNKPPHARAPAFVVTATQVSALEELWKAAPEAKVEDLEAAEVSAWSAGTPQRGTCSGICSAQLMLA